MLLQHENLYCTLCTCKILLLFLSILFKGIDQYFLFIHIDMFLHSLKGHTVHITLTYTICKEFIFGCDHSLSIQIFYLTVISH